MQFMSGITQCCWVGFSWAFAVGRSGMEGPYSQQSIADCLTGDRWASAAVTLHCQAAAAATANHLLADSATTR